MSRASSSSSQPDRGAASDSDSNSDPGAGEAPPCFVLLDDCTAGAQTPTSRLYTRLAHMRVCADPAQLDSIGEQVDADLRAGLHAVVLADYEWGMALQQPDRAGAAAIEPGGPSLRVLLFHQLEFLSAAAAEAWLRARDNDAPVASPAGVLDLRPSVSDAEFDAAIASIHDILAAGDSYQINYTYRLTFGAFGPPLALYRRLRARQPVRYGALIALPDGAWVLSCSPELFLRHADGRLGARPMKGTAPRPADPRQARASAAALAASLKDRAENLMIVDLLRNDLGRIAQIGSVRVPALFSLEPYAAVWQMTSTLEATLAPDTAFPAILRALFPCGSITGAPKHRTMQCIEALESTPRGLYTGAIGWLDAPPPGSARACGDFCLSVAIRTLTLEGRQAPAPDGLRPGRLGVGAGIVLDSQAAAERQECRLKARFLTGADPGFALFETTYATREDGVRHGALHWARLADAARRFAFAWDEAALRRLLAERCAALPPGMAHRLRIALEKDGRFTLSAAPLAPLPAGPVDVLLASAAGFAPRVSNDLFLRYKTTLRASYDQAWQSAERQGAFDMLFCNQAGELTEGGRSNILVKLAGRWVTPPLASGVLPGIMRAVLLADPAWQPVQRVITLDELQAAEALVVCNALRGPVPARLVRPGK